GRGRRRPPLPHPAGRGAVRPEVRPVAAQEPRGRAGPRRDPPDAAGRPRPVDEGPGRRGAKDRAVPPRPAAQEERQAMSTGLLALATAALLPATAQGGGTQPNVIIILADDLGPGDLSCYGGKTPTPNLDRMAQEGVRFTRYYAASPICSPSRCALITGQYPGRWRITSYLQTPARHRACGQGGILDPDPPSL